MKLKVFSTRYLLDGYDERLTTYHRTFGYGNGLDKAKGNNDGRGIGSGGANSSGTGDGWGGNKIKNEDEHESLNKYAVKKV